MDTFCLAFHNHEKVYKYIYIYIDASFQCKSNEQYKNISWESYMAIRPRKLTRGPFYKRILAKPTSGLGHGLTGWMSLTMHA